MSRMGAPWRGSIARSCSSIHGSVTPFVERGKTGALNGGAVRHRIAEGDADFDHIANLGDRGEVFLELAQRRKPGGEIAHQRRLTFRRRASNRGGYALAGLHDQRISFNNVFCRIGMSLSPRPEQPMRICAPGFLPA